MSLPTPVKRTGGDTDELEGEAGPKSARIDPDALEVTPQEPDASEDLTADDLYQEESYYHDEHFVNEDFFHFLASAVAQCERSEPCMRIEMDLDASEVAYFETSPQKFMASKMRSGELSFNKLDENDRKLFM